MSPLGSPSLNAERIGSRLTLWEPTWASDKRLSFSLEPLLNRCVYQVPRVRGCIYVCLSLNTCSPRPAFTRSLKADVLFIWIWRRKRRAGESWRKSRWRGGRRISQNSYKSYQGGGLFIVVSNGVPLHSRSNLESYWAKSGCLWAEYLMIRGRKQQRCSICHHHYYLLHQPTAAAFPFPQVTLRQPWTELNSNPFSF